MTANPDLGSLYGNVRARIIDQVVHGLEDADLATVVPACPAWTVKDLLGHLVGLTDDLLNGNMDDAPSPAWTAAQTERYRDTGLDDLLATWDANAARFEVVVSMNSVQPAVLDIASHEQDLRGALGLAGARENPAIAWGVPRVMQVFGERVAAAGLPPVFIDLEGDESDTVVGGDEPAVRLRTTRFELFRAAFGRRSDAQLRAMGWSDDPTPYLPHLLFFGPAETDLVE